MTNRDQLEFQTRSRKYSSEADVKDMGKKIFTWYKCTKDFPVSQGAYSRKGVADRIICFKGYFVACEYKFNGGLLDINQYQFLLECEQAGGLCLVIDEKNILELFPILDKLSELEWPGGYTYTPLGDMPLSLTERLHTRDMIEEFRPTELTGYY